MRRLTLLTCIIVLPIVCVLEAGAGPPVWVNPIGQLKQPPTTLRGHIICVNESCNVLGGTGFTAAYLSPGHVGIHVSPAFAAPPAYCEVQAGVYNSANAVVECRIDTYVLNPEEWLSVGCFRTVGQSFGGEVYGAPDYVDSEFWFQCYQ